MAKKKSEFFGKAAKLKNSDFERVAAKLSCEIAAVHAVSEVESGGGGGFLKDKRPKILFESRWFHKLTDGHFDNSHPDISTPKWVRNYKGGAGEYSRLEAAIRLDREAALKSASWGMFQILGVNHQVVGFSDIESFVKSQLDSEGSHLDAFGNFVIANRLDDELRDRRWADFAKGYNGPAYKENRYHEKMANANARYAKGGIAPSTREVQQALNRHGAVLTVDGRSGPNTRIALRAFQNDAGLPITGRADQATLTALGLVETHDPLVIANLMNG
jgi:hypothetical protein